SRRRHTRCLSDWSSDVCSSDLVGSARHLAVLTPLPSSRHPGFEIELTIGRAAQVSGARIDDMIGQTEPLKDLLLDREQFLMQGRSEERRVGKECRSMMGRGV